jgi:transposase
VSDGISNKQFVGVDLHLHRSVICRIDEQGRQLDCVQIDNDPKALVAEVVRAGRGAPVAVEATYGWYWAVEALQAAKFEVHLAHPYGMEAMRKRKRVKTDARDADELANLLRLGSLPEGYIAPAELRELRELVRHRRQLTKTATSVKAQIWVLLAKHGIRLPAAAWSRRPGRTSSTR